MVPRFLVTVWMTIAVSGLLLVSMPLAAQDGDGAPQPAQPTPDAPQAAPAEDATPPAAADQEAPAADQEVPTAAEEAAETPPPAAQDQEAVASPAEPAPDRVAAEAAFEAKFAQWKEFIGHLRQLRSDYQTADDANRQALEQDWNETVAKAQQMVPELVDAVSTAYRAAPNADREKTDFLIRVLKDYVDHDKYEQALSLGQILIDNQCDNPDAFRNTAIASFSLHQFDLTEKLLNQAAEMNAIPGDAAKLRGEVATYQQLWAKEQEIRQREAEADDLPRVKLTTSKGDIVVELYENEAPETVGNFISLVKNGFYDGLTFHRVLPGFMAQGGCPDGDGTGGPGYVIYDEYDKPEARMHFRGVLSMAKTNAPNSGGSQFFIAFRPTPQLNGKHTVFGRVIEGMDVVDALQRRDPDAKNPPAPDQILTAQVLRDRGHEYLPKKVE